MTFSFGEKYTVKIENLKCILYYIPLWGTKQKSRKIDLSLNIKENLSRLTKTSRDRLEIFIELRT